MERASKTKEINNRSLLLADAIPERQLVNEVPTEKGTFQLEIDPHETSPRKEPVETLFKDTEEFFDMRKMSMLAFIPPESVHSSVNFRNVLIAFLYTFVVIPIVAGLAFAVMNGIPALLELTQNMSNLSNPDLLYKAIVLVMLLILFFAGFDLVVMRNPQ